jgi:uncharacterized membrane protein (UPF0127 family)
MRRTFAVSLLLVACACGAPGGPGAAATTEVRFETARGPVLITAEVADTPSARARGLMGRTYLAPDRGMLFLWAEAAPREFYMKNTLIGLDVVSINSGRVVGVQEMVPCNGDPCLVTVTPPADAALELGVGVASAHGLRPGVLVDAAPLR